MFRPILAALVLTALASTQPRHVLVEAESFTNRGGWKLDTQFIHVMGSPYLLAHGLGRPVADATTTVELPAAGRWHVWVRTFDWVARWKAPGTPGRFHVLANGQQLEPTFGTKGADWSWHRGGVIEADDTSVELTLRDLTGFDGRCDAILLTREPRFTPPDDGESLAKLRHELLGTRAQPIEEGPFDLVVIGGGYGGTAAAVSAARLGCRVALIQNRPVLGGNGSSEVRVWAKGGIRRGKYPRLGEIVEEFQDRSPHSPGLKEHFEDDKKEALVRAEDNIALFLNHHADRVETDGDRIVAVEAFDTRNGQHRRFVGTLFADCTGHATIGVMAGAEHTLQREGHLGMSNMWRWQQASEPKSYPATPWALELAMGDFPYPRNGKGEWFWESGFDKHPIEELESTRDWNLRAVYGSFQAMKTGKDAAKHQNAELTWIAYIGGPRESRQLLGDVVLTRDDIASKRDFKDGSVPTTWDIDLHYPREEFAKKYPEDPFISRAHFDRSVDRQHGYPVPYRCFYSRNIANLFMAGRCISVDHQALGTVRVMKTGGMVGEVVGKAASLCILHKCEPRAIYQKHLDELKELMQLPGRARRLTVDGTLEVPAPPPGAVDINVKDIPGIVIDDDRARIAGRWTEGQGVSGYVGGHYLYDDRSGKSSATYTLRVRKSGRYRIGITWTAHENRASNAPVLIRGTGLSKQLQINMRKPPEGEHGFEPLHELKLESGRPVQVVISTQGANGHVVADAIQLLPLDD